MATDSDGPLVLDFSKGVPEGVTNHIWLNQLVLSMMEQKEAVEIVRRELMAELATLKNDFDTVRFDIAEYTKLINAQKEESPEVTSATVGAREEVEAFWREMQGQLSSLQQQAAASVETVQELRRDFDLNLKEMSAYGEAMDEFKAMISSQGLTTNVMELIHHLQKLQASCHNSAMAADIISGGGISLVQRIEALERAPDVVDTSALVSRLAAVEERLPPSLDLCTLSKRLDDQREDVNNLSRSLGEERKARCNSGSELGRLSEEKLLAQKNGNHILKKVPSVGCFFDDGYTSTERALVRDVCISAQEPILWTSSDHLLGEEFSRSCDVLTKSKHTQRASRDDQGTPCDRTLRRERTAPSPFSVADVSPRLHVALPGCFSPTGMYPTLLPSDDQSFARSGTVFNWCVHADGKPADVVFPTPSQAPTRTRQEDAQEPMSVRRHVSAVSPAGVQKSTASVHVLPPNQPRRSGSSACPGHKTSGHMPMVDLVSPRLLKSTSTSSTGRLDVRPAATSEMRQLQSQRLSLKTLRTRSSEQKR